MCELSEKIQELIGIYNINEDALVYSWKGQDANAVECAFEGFHSTLQDAICALNTEGVQRCIVDVLHWGGIYRINQNRIKYYADKIFQLHQNPNQDDLIDTNTLLASWTKVLAAYDPHTYWIYDSRVAIAMQMLYDNYSWFLPVRRNDRVCRYLRNQNNDLNTMSPKESYKRYCEILSESRTGADFEKKLFMLGDCFCVNNEEELQIRR